MKKFMTIRLLLIVGLCCNITTSQIVLDEVVKAGDLKLFPTLDNPNVYYYLVDQTRLGTFKNGKPQFSFIRWVKNTITDDAEDSESYKDVEGAGGGIVYGLMELSVTEEQKQEAQQELRRINSKAIIKGPVTYRGGTVVLVSKLGGGETENILGLGPAPLMDGQKIPFSILLTKTTAKILWESFKSNMADLSFQFYMEIEGYNAPISADISFKWEDIYKHSKFQGGLSTPVLQSEVDIAVKEMVSNKVIKIIEKGGDNDFDKIRTVVMEMIQTEIFKSQANTPTPSLAQLTSRTNSRPSMLDRATTMLNQQRTDHERERNREERSRNTSESRRSTSTVRTNGRRSTEEINTESNNTNSGIVPRAGEAVRRASPQDEPSTVPPYQPDGPNTRESESPPAMAIGAAFQFKKEKKSGSVNINLTKHLIRRQQQNFAENIGQFKCDGCFRMFNLDEPLYKQREILAFIDGANAADFGQFINYVSVLLKKKHENKEVTQREIRIDRKNFSRGNNFKFDPYGWKGDNNRSKWLEYEYKATWSFFGGYEVSTPWIKREAGSITLAPPFSKKDIYIEVDDSIIDENPVRFAEVKIFYKQGDKEKIEQVKIDFRKQDLSKRVTIILEDDLLQYDYQVKWILKGKEPITEERKSSSDETIYLSDIGQF